MGLSNQNSSNTGSGASAGGGRSVGSGGSYGSGGSTNSQNSGNFGAYGSGAVNQNDQRINYYDPRAIEQYKELLGGSIGQNQSQKDFAYGGAGYGSAGAGPQGGAGGFYSSMLNSPGYSDAEKAAIQTNTADARNTTYDRAAQDIGRQATITNNPAGQYAAIADLNKARASDAATTQRQNLIDFSNEAQRRKELAGNALQSMLGMSTGAGLNLFNQLGNASTLRGGESTMGSNVGIGGNIGGNTTQGRNDYQNQNQFQNQNEFQNQNQFQNQGQNATRVQNVSEGSTLGAAGGIADLLKGLFGPKGGDKKQGGQGAGGGAPGAGTGGGGRPGAGWKPYIDRSTGKAYTYDPNLGWQNLPTSKPLTQDEIDLINSGQGYIDPNTGEVFTGEPPPELPGGEVPPDQVPGQYEPPPDLPPGWGNQGDTSGASGDGGDGGIWTNPNDWGEGY